ncbi:MAG: hypothetical protein ABIE70_08340 [bacterium]
MSLFKSQWDLPNPEEHPIPAEEDAVMEKLAKKVVEWRMTAPAIMFLESVKPLNYIGSQTMVFFEPIIQSVFNFKDYETLRCALEKRETIEFLLQKIEAHDAVAFAREKRIKTYMKTQRKAWKWHQRWLGIGRPKVQIPEEVLNPPEEGTAPDATESS